MASLYALDFPLGPALEARLRQCVEESVAFCVLDQRSSPRRRRDELEWLGATHVVDEHGVTSLPSGRPVADDIGVVMLTSGSSGPPKAAELSWAALTASAYLTQATLRGAHEPVWLPCLPPNHIGGLAVLLRAILDKASLVWPNSEDLSRGPALGATHVAVVRAQLHRYDLSGYEAVLLGGARPPGNLPANVTTTWGMTETGSGVVYDGYPLPGVEMRVIDGEFCVRTPTLFSRYRNAPRPEVLDEQGLAWFPTGDGATITEGKVAIHGRLGFVINTGGEKIWPDDLEALWSDVTGLREVAVTGVADPEWGERLVALVVTDGRNVDDELRAIAAERLGPWAKPKEIRYVAALPRTSNGKLRRGDLANLF